MREERDRYVMLFQGGMLALNFLAVVLQAVFVYMTTERIRYNYEARTFLDGVTAIPENPRWNMIFCISAMCFLVLTYLFRLFPRASRGHGMWVTLLLDTLVCFSVLYVLDFNYNGLILLLFAYVLAFVRDKKARLLMILLAIFGYLLADYELLSIYMPLYNLDSYIQYYPGGVQQYLYSINNILASLNMVLFIIYCVYVINTQQGTIEEINGLYHELRTANEQLQEYAAMSERMAQTRERNRLAREIHDTLGHTLTGIATGLDACLALIDAAPEQTKKQLQLLSEVSREGLKDIRRSVNELRPDALERLSLEAAVRKMVTDMSRTSDVQIHFRTEAEHLKFDEDEENTIYRVIQESITNAIRHGHAKEIWVEIRQQEGEVILVIRDNGVGAEKIESGFGTKHIKERIEMLHGTVTFNGKHGFTVTAHIPIRWGESYD